MAEIESATTEVDRAALSPIELCDGTFTAVSGGGVSALPGNACAWADYDNDGFLDLFVTAGNSPPSDT